MPNPISVEPWYARSDGQVFHNDTRCAVGLRIPLMERLAGDGRRRLCPECKRLRDQPTLETQDVHSVTRLADRERLQNRILGADAGVDRGASAA